MQFISLFAGSGTFDKALIDLGWECQVQVEIDPHCNIVLNRQFPDIYRLGDIEHVKKTDLPETTDLVVGGTPCTNLSIAGDRTGLAGEESRLFYDFIRVIKWTQPTWVVWENVAGSLSSNAGRDFWHVLHELEKCGYSLAWRVFNSEYFGVPQRRRRIYLIGHLRRGSASKVLFESRSMQGTSATKPSKGETSAEVVGDGDNSTDAQGTVGEGNQAESKHYRDRVRNISRKFFRRIRHGEFVESDVSSTIRARDHKHFTDVVVNITTCDANGNGKDRPNGGLYINETRSANTVTTTGTPSLLWSKPIAFRNFAGSESDVAAGDISPTLTASGSNRVPSVAVNTFDVRNLTVNEELSATLQAKPNGGWSLNFINPLFYPYSVRRFTPQETEALQGLPKGWTEGVADTHRYRMMGNGVTYNVVYWIFERLTRVHNGEDIN